MTVMSYGAPPTPELPSAHGYMAMLHIQLALRRRWDRLFQSFDVVIAPTLGMVAFPHMEGDWASRRVMIDGEPMGFAEQLARAGLATFPNLPAIGIQILGPHLEDRTPLAFARLIEGL
ncbi:MAG TPA: hypothetical protein VH353_02845 [Caulobacteraceae bacterium]|jgi:amidase|nr:hypothetical protein [Caulobacteraceae bacterium]